MLPNLCARALAPGNICYSRAVAALSPPVSSFHQKKIFQPAVQVVPFEFAPKQGTGKDGCSHAALAHLAMLRATSFCRFGTKG
jgi:hypothetical protein